eukprot:scaffold894_cov153-Cylindrotheca_fusiformis.AAC.7
MRVPNSSLRQYKPQWGQSARDRKREESNNRGERFASPSRGRLPIASPTTNAVMKSSGIKQNGVASRSYNTSGLTAMRAGLARDEFREAHRGLPKEGIIDLTDIDDGGFHQSSRVTRIGPNRYRIPIAPASPRGVGHGQARVPPSPPLSPTSPFQPGNLTRNRVANVEKRAGTTHARSHRFSDNISRRLRQIYDSRPEKGPGSISAGSKKQSPTRHNGFDDASYGLGRVGDDQDISILAAREELRNIKSNTTADSGDEFDTKACIGSTQACVQMLADDVKSASAFAQNKVREVTGSSTTSADDDIVDGEREAPEQNAPGVAANSSCVLGTKDCMLSFHEDVTYVASLGASKVHEMGSRACAENTTEATTGETSEAKTGEANELEGTGCIAGTQDCMYSFKEDVAFVASLGMKTIFPKRELPSSANHDTTLVVKGASNGKISDPNGKVISDDDSGIVAATYDCMGQLKEEINFGLKHMHMNDLKMTDRELRGMLVALSGGLSDQALLAIEADGGSVSTESDMASGSELDGLMDELSLNEDSLDGEDLPDIDDLSFDPFLEDEASEGSSTEEETSQESCTEDESSQTSSAGEDVASQTSCAEEESPKATTPEDEDELVDPVVEELRKGDPPTSKQDDRPPSHDSFEEESSIDGYTVNSTKDKMDETTVITSSKKVNFADLPTASNERPADETHEAEKDSEKVDTPDGL